jgi:hypothetical protein
LSRPVADLIGASARFRGNFCEGLSNASPLRADAQGHVIELTGDIAKLLTLPGGGVPDPFQSSARVVAGKEFEPSSAP